MDNEILQIKTSERKFFLQYLMLKKPIFDMYISNLTGKNEQIPAKLIHVISELLYYNHKYSNLEDNERWEKIFNRNHRSMICSDLNIKDSQLNTYFTMLRNYKVIINNRINKPFIVSPDSKEYELIFKFSLNGEK